MSETPHPKAVFLSYASQDAGVAQGLCDALRAEGIEVWFDKNELAGGDAWDRKIRRQIKECALFIPVISANTQARLEGYFRLEWRLAAERTHTMAEAKPFLLPVVIDGTGDADAHVPEEFFRVQWTRLPGGSPAPEFCRRATQLLTTLAAPGGSAAPWPAQGAARREIAPCRPARSPLRWAVATVALLTVLGAGVYFGLNRSTAPKSETEQLIAQMGAIYEKQEDATRNEWEFGESLGAQATRLEQLNAEAWAAYSQMALGLGDYYFDRTRAPLDDALQRAQTAINLQPKSFEARFALASVYRRRGQTLGESEAMLRQLLQEKPADARVLRTLAWIAANAGRAARQANDEAKAAVENAKALQLFDRANAAVPGGDFVALRRKALMLEALGRFAEADEALNRSLALRNGPGVLTQKIASRVTLHNDLKGARALVENLPGSYQAHEDLTDWAARVWLWERNPEKCLAVLRAWRENFMVGTPTHFVTGQAHQLAGRPDAARAEWTKALGAVKAELDAPGLTLPVELNYVYWKGRLSALLGDLPGAGAALRDFEQRSVGANLLGRNFLLASLLAAVGRNEDALQQFGDAVDQLNRLSTPNPNLVRREGVLWVATLRQDPALDALRALPGFPALLAKMTEVSVLRGRAE